MLIEKTFYQDNGCIYNIPGKFVELYQKSYSFKSSKLLFIDFI